MRGVQGGRTEQDQEGRVSDTHAFQRRWGGGWLVQMERVGPRVRWDVYHSGYGTAGGWAFSRNGAWKAARYAIGDFVQGLAKGEQP